jgi:GNAT superfamily N-acetyltransferase
MTLRPVNKKCLQEEVKLMNSLYCQAWADNWGFVPATDAEIDVQAEELKSVLDVDLAFFLYVKDEPVGVCVVLPDFNFLLKKLDGKLGLLGLVKALRYRSRINGLRCILLGVKPGYRSIGVPLVAVNQLLQKATRQTRYEYMEVSWTLEDNRMINGLIEKLGGELYRKYRIYGIDL